MNIVFGSLMALMTTAYAQTPEPSASAPTVETPRKELPEVLVTAPEPRYVAPTLRDRIGRIWAPVLLNGKGPFRLVLDTGATSIAVIAPVVDALGLTASQTQKVRLHGVTGSAMAPVVQIDSVEVGDLFIEGSRVPIVTDAFGGAEGVLAGKMLRDRRIFIDFQRDLIRIERSHGQAVDGNFVRLPIKLVNGHMPMVEISIGSVRVKAILDTGAQITIGNGALREALLRRQREGHEVEVVGVTLEVSPGQSIRVPPIALSTIEIRNMAITFGDMYIFEQQKLLNEPTVLIGMDVIGVLHQLVIDYKRRELLLRAKR